MKFKEKKMPSMFRRKTKNGNEDKPLMKNIEQTDGEQASEYSSQQSGVPDLIALDVEAHNKRVLHTLRKILSDQSTPEDFDPAVEELNTLCKLNNNYSQYWLCEYLQEVDQFVENHFPTLPAERPRGSQLEQIQDFLKRTQGMIYDEVLRLTPALKDAGLLDHLMDSYSRHIFTNLDLLLNRDLSVKEIFCLLLWGKDVFFSSESKLRVDDPLLLTRGFERAKQKLLQVLGLTEAIQKQCASLPQTDVGKEIQEIFVNVSYDCVSRVYLDCLMQSKFRRLERRWRNVGERIREDILSLHNTFTELNGSDDQQNHLLQRLSEVLLHRDVEALKITCCALFRDFPQESEQYVPGLLRWKGVFSERQVREVLDVSRDLGLDLKPRRVTCQPLKGLCCCLI
ncbi:uncharacterized protein [Sinocyclocheilus grahami]|uniref:uncharacterized protein n=1 Tax=Sinocyclocheilus grahami TaxID=75366 RepID=UPI0007AD5675|nr:PREDICTED: uncharacterized protein LOC107582538 [Sinocyclocheilus grahami]